ncbi:putative transcription initiation factor TFIIH subunit 3 [Blattamonas nauphoetae]|uniref:Transcription initiation factor TFIIH subunit 3 n=1 Tax=Blattamonas nauphoetae TaxID=2049346 RepID=A0ABQ9XN59_9EUKA|nr:putative transcription initiation factor TFIIH subunit 3 [Blattamonas nauphoetae]
MTSSFLAFKEYLTIFILDINPFPWTAQHQDVSSEQSGNQSFQTYLQTFLAFVSTYISIGDGLAVILTSSPSNCSFLDSSLNPTQSLSSFAAIAEELQNLIATLQTVTFQSEHSLISEAISKALCYINSVQIKQKQLPGTTKTTENPSKLSTHGTKTHIVVFTASEPNPRENTSIINCAFSSVKLDVNFHSCCFRFQSQSGSTTNPLHHASSLSGGVFLSLPDNSDEYYQSLILHLLPSISRPDPITTLKMAPKLSYTVFPTCRCHNKPIKLGYLCSSCFTIHCSLPKKCVGCTTTFDTQGTRSPIIFDLINSQPSIGTVKGLGAMKQEPT